MKVAVLIPCYNESLTIDKVVRDFKRELSEAVIYVFDNASTDDTAQVAEKAGATVYSVKQRGKGNVVRRMFNLIQADAYIIVDGDDTYPAESARKLLEPILSQEVDLVIGDRLSNGSYAEHNQRKWHSFGNRIVSWLINYFFKGNMRDIMTGYRAMSRRFVKTTPIMSPEFEVETEMAIHTLHHKIPFIEIPIDYRDRPEGSNSKLHTFRDGAKVLKTIFTILKEYKPLAVFSFFAFLFGLTSITLGVPVVFEYWQTGLVPRLPTAVLSMGLSILSALSFAIGLILDTFVIQNKKSFDLRNR